MSTRRKTASAPVYGFKADASEPGTFEAVVAVFNNVDHGGDRILPGAFADSLARWKATGDPIPVIVSHQWHDLNAWVGTVPADDDHLRELLPGDPALPDAIRDLGGLYVKASLFDDDPDAAKVRRLLTTRALREFSFAYDVEDEAKAADGYNDLRTLDLIEVGPTLKGMNPATQLVAAKAGPDAGGFAEVARTLGVKLADVVAAFKRGAGRAERQPDAKAFVSVEGSLELLAEKVERQAAAWAVDAFPDVYTVYTEATFADRVIFYVESWDDPLGGGRYFEAPFEVAGDTVTLGDPEPVTITATVTRPDAKARRKEGRRNSSSDQAKLQDAHDLLASLGATCAAAEPDGTSSTDDEDDDEDDAKARSSRPGPIAATIAAELLDL